MSWQVFGSDGSKNVSSSDSTLSFISLIHTLFYSATASFLHAPPAISCSSSRFLLLLLIHSPSVLVSLLKRYHVRMDDSFSPDYLVTITLQNKQAVLAQFVPRQ